jgi:hypothetical protein
MASEFLAAERFEIFALVMSYYLRRYEHARARGGKPQDATLIKKCAADVELAELALAIEMSTALVKRAQSREEVKKKEKTDLPQEVPKPVPKVAFKPSAVPVSGSSSASTPSHGDDDDKDSFKVTGKHIQLKAIRGPLTLMTSTMMADRVTKLKEMEDSLLNQLAALRIEQEKSVRDNAEDLATKMKAKREAAAASQKKK